MKLIKPSYEILPDVNTFTAIERAGRLCYKSEDKIDFTRYFTVPLFYNGYETDPIIIKARGDKRVECVTSSVGEVSFISINNSIIDEYSDILKYECEKDNNHTNLINTSIPFTDMLVKRKHYAMLEHGTIYLDIPNYQSSFPLLDNKTLRTEDFKAGYILDKLSINPYTQINNWEYSYYVTTNYRVIIENNWEYILKYNSRKYTPHPERISVKFICDKGITHELVRHRLCSFAQESTRYCNYSKDKFNNEITCIEPLWYDQIICEADHIYIQSLIHAERAYFDLLKNGGTPQQARSVLPHSLKTEIIVTAFLDEWKHIFSLRADSAAHPQMRELMIPLQEEFKQKGLI